jgi:HNH endonuclease/NUMOD4 motif-containing protein
MAKWKPVLGYESVYEASDEGQIRRIDTGRILKPGRSKTDYLNVGLSKDGVIKHYSVHRLVAEAFLGKRPDGMFVNHINSIPSDNRPENLEYVTPKGNIEHSIKHGHFDSNGLERVLVERIVKLILAGEKYGAIAKECSVGKATVQAIAGGYRKLYVQRYGITAIPSQNRAVKLTQQEVDEIRIALDAKLYLQQDIAKQYNVSPGLITRIKQGKVWKR